MKIISINAGSSSLKFQLFDMNDENAVIKLFKEFYSVAK